MTVLERLAQQHDPQRSVASDSAARGKKFRRLRQLKRKIYRAEGPELTTLKAERDALLQQRSPVRQYRKDRLLTVRWVDAPLWMREAQGHGHTHILGAIVRMCKERGIPETAWALCEYYKTLLSCFSVDGLFLVGVDLPTRVAEGCVPRPGNKGDRGYNRRKRMQHYNRLLAEMRLLRIAGRGRFQIEPLTCLKACPLGHPQMPLAFAEFAVKSAEKIDSAVSRPCRLQLIHSAEVRKQRRSERALNQPRGVRGRFGKAGCAAGVLAASPAPEAPLPPQEPRRPAFAPAPPAPPASEKCAAKADADVGDGPPQKPRTRPPLPGARALTPAHAAVPGRFFEKEEPKPERTPIPSHLRGAERAAWVEERAKALASRPNPAASAPTPFKGFEPPTAADWMALTDEHLAAAEQMPPNLRDRYVRMMARLPAHAPEPTRVRPPATVQAKVVAAPEQPRRKPVYRYRQPGDDAVADATWLGFELAPLPCMKQTEKGRSPPSVVQLVKLRYRRGSWRAAVATLLHRAPGTIKASPVAFIVAMAKQMEAGTAHDPRRDEHWFAVDSWPLRMRQFAGRTERTVEEKCVKVLSD